MRTVLFAWRRYTPPFLLGGAEVTQQLLAEEFASSGWWTTYLGSYEAPWSGVSELIDIGRQLIAWGVHHTYDNVRGELRVPAWRYSMVTLSSRWPCPGL